MVPHFRILKKLMLVDWTEISQDNMVRFKVVVFRHFVILCNCLTYILCALSLPFWCSATSSIHGHRHRGRGGFSPPPNNLWTSDNLLSLKEK
jgi:hypothetical protein